MKATVEHLTAVNSHGDLHFNSGNFYSGGDGRGPGDTGPYVGNWVAIMEGDPSKWTFSTGDEAQIVSTDLPYGPIPKAQSHKICSLLDTGSKLHAAVEWHMRPQRGVVVSNQVVGTIATSFDRGKTWRETMDSEWQDGSPFACLHFVNGRVDDGYTYAFGIGQPRQWDGPVYLARVLTDLVAHYSAWQYFTGRSRWRGVQWTKDQYKAVPVPGLSTEMRPSAIWHTGLQKYLFLGTTATIGLFASNSLWQGWERVTMAPPSIFNTGYMPGLIAGYSGKDFALFTIAGKEGTKLDYRMNIGKIVFK